MSPSLDGQVSWLAERGMKTAGNISSARSPVSVVVEVALFPHWAISEQATGTGYRQSKTLANRNCIVYTLCLLCGEAP
jgi:hypothetical protein